MLALCLLPVARSQEATPEQQFERLQQAYQQAEQAFLESATEDTDWGTHPARDYLEKFQEFADAHEGAPVAAQALVQVLDMAMTAGAQQAARYAIVDLTDGYLESEQMARVAGQLSNLASVLGERFCVEHLSAILDGAPGDDAKAAALMALGEVHSASGKVDVAREYFVRLKDEFAATDAAARAAGWIFELEHLQVGMIAPDFEAVDQAGERFKLSDYRGKVTVVDFWGFW